MTLDGAPDVMKVPEVARVLRIGRNAAYELVQRGELQAVHIGRSVRVTRWALEAYLRGMVAVEAHRKRRGPGAATPGQSPSSPVARGPGQSVTHDRRWSPAPPWVAEVTDGPLLLQQMPGGQRMRNVAAISLLDLPAVREVAERALLTVGDAPQACRHVLAGLPAWEGGPRLCAQHPDAGLLCHGCLGAHIGTHSDVEEHTCDECRREVLTIQGLAFPLPVQAARTRRLDGRRRMVPGPILLGGLGLCFRCHRKAVAA